MPARLRAPGCRSPWRRSRICRTCSGSMTGIRMSSLADWACRRAQLSGWAGCSKYRRLPGVLVRNKGHPVAVRPSTRRPRSRRRRCCRPRAVSRERGPDRPAAHRLDLPGGRAPARHRRPQRDHGHRGQIPEAREVARTTACRTHHSPPTTAQIPDRNAHRPLAPRSDSNTRQRPDRARSVS
jgi:hypothetical protein